MPHRMNAIATTGMASPFWQLAKQKDREVGDDQRDIDNREPAGRNAIGVRDHVTTSEAPEPVLTARGARCGA